MKWTGLPTVSQVGSASILLIFAFMGIEVALVPSGEVVNPARTVPRSIFLALAITTAMYLVIQTVAQGLLGPSMSNGLTFGRGGKPANGAGRADD